MLTPANRATNNITINTGVNGIVDWSSSATYDVGDVVQSGGLRYVANTAHTATGGVFADDTANWDQVDETINGSSSYVINTDYGSVTLGFRNDGKIFVLS